ncbi:hypothetical protein V6N13_054918 [Hibiscus sabdariffa]|uniref:Sulfotransferase n=1 Tax=Hibiscus sabdariffa TaxID=183260 RepID=A0ABR2DWC4_9ROSI
MDTAATSKAEVASLIRDVEKSWDAEVRELAQTLPKEEGWISGTSLYLYQGYWCNSLEIKTLISFQTHFRALDSDVIVATFPKCGTTWLKALTFSTLHRSQFAEDENPLLSFTPHQLVRFLELDVYLNNPCPDLESICLYKPRLVSTHVPYASLPASIKDSNCKIVYICRNPMDMFISLWLFTCKLRDEIQAPLSLDQAFDKFCRGIHHVGPFFDHLKHLAMFLGVPFTEDEEKRGVVEEKARICSFEKLKEVEVNKQGSSILGIPNESFFRKAKVGDWSNHLTLAMVERMDKLIQQKLENSGLTFKFSYKT